MGVPKFYRWISERYPCLSEVVKEYQVPEFDNLYLDMNGIIHVCSHPNDDDPHFRITEEQIFKDIFHYIEVLFRIVRPRKVFFMAVDGVAPRAKMNQQRGRRFRSAKEAEENIKKALAKGEELPKEKRFDSNCITPGTKFMVRLQEQLEYMVKSKVSTDRAWQGLRIYLSGHETPGEGEHKITEFIRNERLKPDYDPNTRHCLYGLDADLMMLGLCSHEPHFSLLREEVRFTGKKKHSSRTAKPEETTFHLLHLSLMREYIDHEFECLKNTLPFEYNLEAIIDDWVLMGFLVGNDFIPHLPNLHIAHNALPMLYETYMKVLPTLDGYLNVNGLVNLERFGKYLKELSKFDLEKFEEVYADFKWLESKVGKKKSKGKQSRPQNIKKSKGANEVNSFGSLEDECSSSSFSSEKDPGQKSIEVITELSIKQGLTSPDSEVDSVGSQDDKSTYELEFQLYKRNYYQEKLHFAGTDGDVAKIAYEYILAIQWICHYYYNGVQSWSWYYPYHYAPFLSDLNNLSKMKLKYDMAKPFLPYEQLLAVLPAGSKECLPEPFWDLMSSKISPIIDYYPTEFTCDLNGKQQEWEAVVLIPFINEERLLAAMDSCLKKLNTTDKERNRHSGCQLYVYDANLDYYVKSSLPGKFPNIAHCKAKLELVPLHSWSKTEISRFVKGILPGCKLSVYYPGFPTMYHLPHTRSLEKRGVKVFQMPSRSESMILSILPPGKDGKKEGSGGRPYSENDSLEDVAENLLGASIFVNWPHMEEAKVVGVSDGKTKYEVTEHIHASGKEGSQHKRQKKSLSKQEQESFWQDVDDIADIFISRRGIDIKETSILVYVQPLLGRSYNCSDRGEITLEKQWAANARPYPLQTAVKDISVKDHNFQNYKGVDELFPVDSTVFVRGQPYYGCEAKVLQCNRGMVSLEVKTPFEPDIDNVARQIYRLSSKYYHGWELGARLGVSSYLLSRITGTLLVFHPPTKKWQVGLDLRSNKENAGVCGFTKRVNNEWLYSELVEKTIDEYIKKFPEVLKYLQIAITKNEREFDAAQMTKQTRVEAITKRLEELQKWLKSLDSYNVDKTGEHSDLLEPKVVQAVLQKVEELKGQKRKPRKPVQISVRPGILYRPTSHEGTLIPDKTTKNQLLDRIVNVRDCYTVPLGTRGTIIGIHNYPAVDTLYDVVFDMEFLGGSQLKGRCPARRGYCVPECAIINISHGIRIANKDRKPTAIVKPHHKQQNNRQAWGNPQQAGLFQHRGAGGRDGSPRHAQPDPRRPPQKGRRPQSSQQAATNVTSIMQRPSSSSTVQPGASSSENTSAAPRSSSRKMFDDLWNTLKEENTKQKGAATQSQEQRSAPSNANNQAIKKIATKVEKGKTKQESATSAEHVRKGQKCVTSAENVRNEQKSEEVKKESAKLPSLSQAAKSLPSVALAQQTESKDATNEFPGDGNNSTQKINKTQQTSTNPTTTVTQATSSIEKSDLDHLNNLFKSIKTPQPGAKPFTPKLAFTPTQVLHHAYSKSKPFKPAETEQPPQPPVFPQNRHPFQNFPPFYAPYGPSQPQGPYPNNVHPFMMRPPYHPHQDPRTAGFGRPPPFPPFVQHFPYSSSPSTEQNVGNKKSSPRNQLKNEGTQKLCEMLNSESDDASSKWSTGEVEEESPLEEKNEIIQKSSEEATQKLTKKFENLTVKDGVSDCDSDKDEDFIERSTSVEDEGTPIIKKQTNVDDLLSLCSKCGMLAPIYTYYTTDDEQVVSTVQLWNGSRFSSHPQKTRDKAMEEAAGQGLGYLRNELRENRPVSTSPPATSPYYVTLHNVVTPQYYPTHAFASPVTYASAPHPYYYPTTPYTMLPTGPVVTMPSEYTQPALLQHAYRYNPQYTSPYFQHYPVAPTMQVSPTHQPKRQNMYQHQVGASAQPVLWNYYYKDGYLIQDKANAPRTEFKLLDQPPVSKDSEDEKTKRNAEQPAAKDTDSADKADVETSGDDPTKASTPQKQNQSKPKLAISFNQENN